MSSLRSEGKQPYVPNRVMQKALVGNKPIVEERCVGKDLERNVKETMKIN